MVSLTLTKAGRLQDRIRAAVRGLPLVTHVTLGIFTPEPAAAVERQAAGLRENLDALKRLLSILASVRAATARANAQHGISDLLAEKAAIDEEISLLSNLVPTQLARGASGNLDGYFGAARRPSLRRHAGEVEEQVRAMMARYAHANEGEATLDAPLLDDAEAERLRATIGARRRRLEEIGDRLRELNSSVLIEIDDAALAYLREQEVI